MKSPNPFYLAQAMQKRAATTRHLRRKAKALTKQLVRKLK